MMGRGRRDLTSVDILQAIKLYSAMTGIVLALVGLLALIQIAFF